MPTYSFRDKDTGEIFDKFMKISEREEFLKNNPMYESVVTAPKVLHERGTNLKVTDGFREALSKVKETYTVNNIKSY